VCVDYLLVISKRDGRVEITFGINVVLNREQPTLSNGNEKRKLDLFNDHFYVQLYGSHVVQRLHVYEQCAERYYSPTVYVTFSRHIRSTVRGGENSSVVDETAGLFVGGLNVYSFFLIIARALVRRESVRYLLDALVVNNDSQNPIDVTFRILRPVRRKNVIRARQKHVDDLRHETVDDETRDVYRVLPRATARLNYDYDGPRRPYYSDLLTITTTLTAAAAAAVCSFRAPSCARNVRTHARPTTPPPLPSERQLRDGR